MDILAWDIYEIRATGEALHNVMPRGRIRKFAIENKFNCLVENSSDEENVVRFALLAGSSTDELINFIIQILPTGSVEKVMNNIENPVLSKLKVNDLTRYN